MEKDKQRRKELLAQYKELPTYFGVIRVTNTENGRMFVSAFPNLKNKWHTIQGQLQMGKHYNAALQRDWNECGPDAFTYEVLQEEKAGDLDVRYEMKRMEKQWMKELRPYGERGYHKEPEEEEAPQP